jgi:hypothetical protein
MGLDCGSLGRELWLGFFSVIRQRWTSSSNGTLTSTFASTVTHMLRVSARIRLLRSLGGQEVVGRFSGGNKGSSSSSLAPVYVQKLTVSVD